MVNLRDEKVNKLLRRLFTSNDGKELVEYLQFLEFDCLQRSVSPTSDILTRQLQGRSLAYRELYEALQTAKS